MGNVHMSSQTKFQIRVFCRSRETSAEKLLLITHTLN